MAKKILQSGEVSTPGGIMSQGVEVSQGKMVFVSGQVARNLDGSVHGVGDITDQTRKVLQNMEAVLAESGAVMDDVVKVTVFVTNLADHFSEIQKVRTAFLNHDYPSSTMVQVTSLVHEDSLINFA